jgi:Putative peptidoglycan binding domain
MASKDQVADVHVVSGGGMASAHPPRTALPVLVGPATDQEKNTIRDGLQPIACWRMDDIRFEFDSSFVRPEAKEELIHLGTLVETYKGAPLSLFGHADPVGNDDYNKQLSGRRAKATYGVLTRNTDLWEELYKEPFVGDNWKEKSIQMMLTALGHYGGPINGVLTKETRDAVKEFQAGPKGQAAGLKVDGDPGKSTRPVLYLAYMDHICVNKNGIPFRLDPKKDFLAHGADAKNFKGDFQACSEFNPVLLFSEEDEKRFKNPANKKERDAANAPNRRVVAFLFQPGTEVTPEEWPCPKVVKGPSDQAGIKVCQSRFWSDHEKRRNTHLPGEKREYLKTRDTFACRFYDRLARRSPCEAGFKEWILRILKGLSVGPIQKSGAKPPPPKPLSDHEPLSNEPFVVIGSGGPAPEIHGTTDVNGFLRFKVHDDVAKMLLKIAGLEITLNGGTLPEINASFDAVKERLHNMAYGKDKLAEWDSATEFLAIRQFQRDHSLPDNGVADDTTKDKIREVHGS